MYLSSTMKRPATSANKPRLGLQSRNDKITRKKSPNTREKQIPLFGVQDSNDVVFKTSEEMATRDEILKTPDIAKKKKLAGLQNMSYVNKSVDELDKISSSVFADKQSSELTKQSEVDLSTTPAQSEIKGRTTATPSRFIGKKSSEIFVLDSDSFIQSAAAIEDIDTLILNFEDTQKARCMAWWEITKDSSMKELQFYFVEEGYKQLIHQQQIVLMLAMGYIELMKPDTKKNVKSVSSIKNVLTNCHKNTLILKELICKSLDGVQKAEVKEWIDELFLIFQNKFMPKSYYKGNNAGTLARNTEISVNLLKTLSRTNADQNDFMKLILDVLKSLDSFSVESVYSKARF